MEKGRSIRLKFTKKLTDELEDNDKQNHHDGKKDIDVESSKRNAEGTVMAPGRSRKSRTDGTPESPDNEEILQKCREILEKVMRLEAAEPFNTPVDVEGLGIPDYLKVIKKPMDLGTVLNNLKNGKYSTTFEVLEDVELVWGNCRKYNERGEPILKLLRAVETHFNRLWAESGFIRGQLESMKSPARDSSNTEEISKAEGNPLIDSSTKPIKKRSRVKIIEPTPPEGSPDTPGESELKKGGRKSKREDFSPEVEEKEDEGEEVEGEKDDGFKIGVERQQDLIPPPRKFPGVAGHREDCGCVVCEGLRRREERFRKYGRDIPQWELEKIRRNRRRAEQKAREKAMAAEAARESLLEGSPGLGRIAPPRGVLRELQSLLIQSGSSRFESTAGTGDGVQPQRQIDLSIEHFPEEEKIYPKIKRQKQFDSGIWEIGASLFADSPGVKLWRLRKGGNTSAQNLENLSVKESSQGEVSVADLEKCVSDLISGNF